MLQYSALSSVYQIISISILIVMTIVEVIRLYVGFIGNLREQVSDLWHTYSDLRLTYSDLWPSYLQGDLCCLCDDVD